VTPSFPAETWSPDHVRLSHSIGAWNRQHEACAAERRDRRIESPAVRHGDAAGDREPEADARAGWCDVGGAAPKWGEQVLRTRPESRAIVIYDHDDVMAGRGAEAHADVTAARCRRDRVLDQVPDRGLEHHGVAVDLIRGVVGRARERDPDALRARRQLRHDRVDALHDLDLHARGWRIGAGARQRQQTVDQGRHPAQLVEGGDISATGQIEQIEEVVACVPEAVTRAFAARYPKASMLKAEKQTRADHSITFELAFKTGKTVREATFRVDGTFVEE
jgi:hypothetical protein